MLKYLSKRIGRSILTLFVIVTLVFCLLLAAAAAACYAVPFFTRLIL